MATMLLVLSGMCLLSGLAWRPSASIVTPVGAAAAVAASFLVVPPGPLVLPVTFATGLVAAFALASALGVLHPPEPHHQR